MKDKSEEVLLTIRCLTYNHEPYIRQCLEGFVMQKTNFRYVAVIHDDASTDGTAEIIREFEKKYPEIIKPIYQKNNLYSKKDGSIGRILNKHMQGKYIAMCEGDDYWVDPLKLQKQVDFLEENEEYGLCYTRTNIYIQETNDLLNHLSAYPDGDVGLYELLLYNRVQTLTTCYRKNIFDEYNETSSKVPSVICNDYKIWLYFAVHSKIYRIGDVTSVYRVLNNSLSHNAENIIPIILDELKLFEYYTNNYISNYNSLEFNEMLSIKTKKIYRQILKTGSRSIYNEYIRIFKRYKINKLYVCLLNLILITHTNNVVLFLLKLFK